MTAAPRDALPREGERILVLGLGLSGRSAALFCAERGARVVAHDDREGSLLASSDDLGDSGIELRFGPDAFPDPADFDRVVPSPGLPYERYAGRARRVQGDIELAGFALPIPIAAVTGTNGKSTTVSMTEAMLRASGLRAKAAGNLGIPALSLVGEPLDCAVLEVSSFQLEATEHFRPKVACVLNLSPDHLDRHGDLAGYAAAKKRLLANQKMTDVAVLGLDDPLLQNFEFDRAVRGRRFPFSMRRALDDGVWGDGSALVVSRDGCNERFALDGFEPSGSHDLENAAAALAIAVSLGAEPHRAVRGLADYQPLPHRCELVREIDGVRYVNDSKATNPGAAERALAGQGRPVVWIAGGRAKQTNFESLAQTASSHASHALLIGEASSALSRALSGRLPVEECGDLERAVVRAQELARGLDAASTVLLAPACASFDQYESFAARGDDFRRCVAALARGEDHE